MQHKGLSRENKDLTEARALCRAAGSCESKLVKASYAPKATKNGYVSMPRPVRPDLPNPNWPASPRSCSPHSRLGTALLIHSREFPILSDLHPDYLPRFSMISCL